ncbi:MAG: beta-lactamase family protein [Bacteroidetes bacterium]|nr:beta-lactamase family protein [Bacteroidota bacterium]
MLTLLIVLFLTRFFFNRYLTALKPFYHEIELKRSEKHPHQLDLYNILYDHINQQNLTGVQAAIVFSDGQVLKAASGTADKKRKTPLKSDNIIRIGSFTKTFTAVLVLQLEAEGKINLDNRLSSWFPEYEASKNITVRQLLNHSSGLKEVIKDWDVLIRSMFYVKKKWKPREMVSKIFNSRNQFAPGSSHGYSNSNYILLGLIVEKVMGTSMAELLRERIIQPLQLDHTVFLPDDPAPSKLVIGYDREHVPYAGYLEVKADDISWSTLAFSSGAMASTASDMARFYHALFLDNFLSKSGLECMTSFVSVGKSKNKWLTCYGLGLFCYKVNGQNYWGHEGSFVGSDALTVYHPASQTAISIVGNVSTFDHFAILEDIQKKILVKESVPIKSAESIMPDNER